MDQRNLSPIPENPLEYFDTFHAALRGVVCTGVSGQNLSVEDAARLAIDTILAAKARSRKALLFGNGGSAAIISHTQCDLMNAVGMRAIVFNETPLLTALTNDHGYETAFETPVSMWSERDDLVIAVSSSGRSENILRGVRSARDAGCFVLGFSGFQPDNPLRALGDINFYVPSQAYGFVEMAHAVLLHYLADIAMIRGKAG